MTTTGGPLWLLALPLFLFAALTAWLTYASCVKCEFHLVYPIDDTYIHLAMANNLAHHAVWGITRYEFSSSSSSLLWTLLLSAVTLVWSSPDAAPLLLNVLLGLGLLCWLGTVVARATGRHWLGALAGLATVIIVPLPVIALNGMEHLLHAWLTLALLWVGVQELASEAPRSHRLRCLGALSLLLVMSRFEGLFLVGFLALLFALRRRVHEAATVLICGVLPVVVFALISLHYGSMVLPNSVLLKGAAPHGGLFVYCLHLVKQEIAQLRSLHHLAALVVGGLLLLAVARQRREHFWTETTLLPVLAVLLIVAHLAFAARGVRYEAYLAVVAIFAFTIAAAHLSAASRRGVRALLVTAGVLMALPWLPRAHDLARDLPGSAANIYQQQYQMGLFLRDYYQGATVVANDIGAINYLADFHCFDWWGLGTIEVARARLAKTYNPALMDRMARARGATLAIIYDDWLRDYVGEVPRSWVPVGRWTIPNNLICAYPTVTFHALDPRAAPLLRSRVARFTLPRPVGREIIPVAATSPPAPR